MLVGVGATAFASCSGRTADNMTPTGETVEVEVEQAVAADTVADIGAAADTVQNI